MSNGEVIVTGASGFIGGALMTGFGEKAIGIKRSADGDNFIKADLTLLDDADRIVKELEGFEYKYLIHTAAATPWSNDTTKHADIDMAKSVVYICEHLKIPHLIFLSGWNVYDINAPVPVTEACIVNPVTEYGKNKLEVERYLKDNLVDTKLLILRLASIYGPGQTSKGLIPNLVSTGLSEGTIELSSATTRRDYLYIDDLVLAIMSITNKSDLNQNDVINIGSGESVSAQCVAELVKDILDSKYRKHLAIHSENDPTNSLPVDNALDISKAERRGVAIPETPLRFGLERYIDWSENENILRP